MRKTIYELRYRLEGDNNWNNVLFANVEDAYNMLKTKYAKCMSINNDIITSSFVVDRILF